MPRFLMLARDDDAGFSALSPDEAQAVIGKYIEWSSRLRAGGKLLAGEKLRDHEGRVLGRSGEKLEVTDGPYTEVKEVVGGYWVIEAATYDDVQQLAASCPHLQFGTLEVRQIEELDRA